MSEFSVEATKRFIEIIRRLFIDNFLLVLCIPVNAPRSANSWRDVSANYLRIARASRLRLITADANLSSRLPRGVFQEEAKDEHASLLFPGRWKKAQRATTLRPCSRAPREGCNPFPSAKCTKCTPQLVNAQKRRRRSQEPPRVENPLSSWQPPTSQTTGIAPLVQVQRTPAHTPFCLATLQLPLPLSSLV